MIVVGVAQDIRLGVKDKTRRLDVSSGVILVDAVESLNRAASGAGLGDMIDNGQRATGFERRIDLLLEEVAVDLGPTRVDQVEIVIAHDHQNHIGALIRQSEVIGLRHQTHDLVEPVAGKTLPEFFFDECGD